MPNAFTRVPERPVPPLPAWALAVMPLADRFMVVLVSRPPTGTLRTTWVTPATLQLCSVLSVVCGVIGAVLLASGIVRLEVRAVVFGVLLVAFGAGCLSVALVGIAQRRAKSS